MFDSGKPVRQATVELVPAQPGPSPRGKTDAEGQFVLGTYESEDGSPAGDYRALVVQVLPPRAAEKVRKLGEAHAAHGGTIPVVSLKYATLNTTDLSCTVQASSDNNVKFVVDAQ